MFLYWKHYPAIASSGQSIPRMRDCIPRPQNPVPQLGTLFCRRRILFCGRGIPFRWLLLVLNHIWWDSWNCLFEYTWKWFFWRILRGDQISVYASFWHLEAPYWSLQTFSAHSNLSSHSGISDTFVMYTQSILLINWKQVAPKYL